MDELVQERVTPPTQLHPIVTRGLILAAGRSAHPFWLDLVVLTGATALLTLICARLYPRVVT